MTDWYGELSKTESKTQAKPEAKTDWYGELATQSEDFKRLSDRPPIHVREPDEIERMKARPGVPDAVERLYVVDNPKYGGSLAAHAKQSFADNTDTIIKMAAKERFPDLPIEEATKRYGIVAGNLVYVGDDGNLYREWPSAEMSVKSVSQQIAASSGRAIPDVMSLGTGIATAPMLTTGPTGAATSVGLTAGARGLGETIRQGVGRLLVDDPVEVGPIIKETATGAAEQLLAGGATGYMGRSAARDLSRIDRPASEALAGKANKYGIPLTPAEQTNLPSLKSQQKALSNLPYSSDIMDDFYKMRGGKVSEAVGKTLDDISRVESGELAGQAGRKAADEITAGMTAARAKQAKPLYDKAFASKTPVDIKPVVSYIDSQLTTAKGGIKTTLEKARSLLMKPGTEELDDSVIGLHNAKMAIDDMISNARESGIGNVSKAKLMEVKHRLLKQIDAISPDYKSARALYADVSPGIEKVKEGVVGILSDLKDQRLQKAGQILFDPKTIGPRSVREARGLFYGAKQQDKWNALLRSYLQEHFEKAGQEYATAGGVSTQGAKFRAAMFGNPKQRDILKAAMEPQQYQALSDLMDVLEATGRAAKVGSDTAWNQEAMREIRRQSGGVTSNIVAPHQIPGKLRDWYEQVKLGKYSENLAKIITSPDAVKKLKSLRQVSPRSARATVIAANALGLLTEEGIDSISPKETRLPETYEAGDGKKNSR